MSRKNPPTVALVSLGCPKNLVDSERMLAGLALGGFAITTDPDGADVAVVNTCAFIDLARAESDQHIDALETLKREGRLGRIVVAGCMAQRYGRTILERHPGIDAIVGISEREALAEVCCALLRRPARKKHDRPPAAAPASAQGEFLVPLDAAIQPRRGIAKTLAAILPPAAGPPVDVLGSQGELAPLGAPPEFAASRRGDFRADHALIAESRGVSQAQPDEVRHLVDEDSRKLRARAIESDPPLAEKRCRMHRPAPVTQRAHDIHPDGRASQRRHAPHHGRSARIPRKKQWRRHYAQGTARRVIAPKREMAGMGWETWRRCPHEWGHLCGNLSSIPRLRGYP